MSYVGALGLGTVSCTTGQALAGQTRFSCSPGGGGVQCVNAGGTSESASCTKFQITDTAGFGMLWVSVWFGIVPVCGIVAGSLFLWLACGRRFKINLHSCGSKSFVRYSLLRPSHNPTARGSKWRMR